MTSVEKMLTDITAIRKKYELIHQKTGSYFNIFDIANIAYKEVPICRVLHELLNPDGRHSQGAIYLELFVEQVLGIKDFDVKSARVHREFEIDWHDENGLDKVRRIDLAVENGKYFIPIEVKIYAGEQESQCLDYYRAAAKNTNIYYLTLHGDPPSEYSAKGLTPIEGGGYEEVTTISFEHDILEWLYACVSHKSALTLAPIREILIQLIAVVRRLTGQVEEETEVEIKEILMQSGENMCSAVQIAQSLDTCKADMMMRIFRALEDGLKNELGLIKDTTATAARDLDYEKLVPQYYGKNPRCPGISYLYKQNIKNGVDIYLRIEVKQRLFFGFCNTMNGEYSDQLLSKEEIKLLLGFDAAGGRDWWAYCEFLPNNEKATSPDFRYHNDALFNLFDKALFDDFIRQSLNSIKRVYEFGKREGLLNKLP